MQGRALNPPDKLRILSQENTDIGSTLQCVAVQLQCGAVWCSVLQCMLCRVVETHQMPFRSVLQCVL